MNKYLVFVGIGFELLALIGAAIVIGQWMGNQMATAGLILLALIGWLVHIIILFKKTR